MPTLTADAVLAGLTEILAELADVRPGDVTPQATFAADLEVDSLTMVELVVACEERFGVRLDDDELADLTTVGDVVGRLAGAAA